MDLQAVLILAGLGVGSFFLAKLGVKADNRVEDRRRHAVDLAGWARSNGLTGLGSLLSSYAVGDYSGAVSALSQIRDTISDPEQSKQILDTFLKTQLDKKLADSDGKAAILDYVQKRLGVVLTVAPAPAPEK